MDFFNLPPRTMTLTAVLLGYLMIDELDAPEQNELGNFFMLVGQVLSTNASGQQIINARINAKRMKALEDNYQELLNYVKNNSL